MDHTPCKTGPVCCTTTPDNHFGSPPTVLRKKTGSFTSKDLFRDKGAPDNHVDFLANIVFCKQFHECLVLENPTWCGHVSSGTDQTVIDLWNNLGWYDSAIEIKISYHQCTFVHYSVFFMPILNVWTYLSASPLVAGCLGAAVVCKIPFLFTNL